VSHLHLSVILATNSPKISLNVILPSQWFKWSLFKRLSYSKFASFLYEFSQYSDQATGWTTTVRFSVGARYIFLFATASRPVLGLIQPPMQWVPEAPSPWVKRPWCITYCSFPSSADVKNTWGYTPTPPYVFMAYCLVKCRIIIHGMALS
jgi:hypothetical protein